MTPEIGERFDYQGNTYVITEVEGSTTDAAIWTMGGVMVSPEKVVVTAERLDILLRKAAQLDAVLNAFEADQRG